MELNQKKKTMTCNVPQGSVLGAPFYSDYTEPVGDVIRLYDVIPHFYADDSQSYVHFYPTPESLSSAVESIETCCVGIKDWMTTNMLKLNDEKPRLCYLGQICNSKS